MKLDIIKKININFKKESEEKSIKVDGKTIFMAKNVWNILLSFVGGGFASIGAYSLVQPALRLEVITLFTQFFDEVGLFI